MPKIFVTNNSTSTYHRKCGHMFFETQCSLVLELN